MTFRRLNALNSASRETIDDFVGNCSTSRGLGLDVIQFGKETGAAQLMWHAVLRSPWWDVCIYLAGSGSKLRALNTLQQVIGVAQRSNVGNPFSGGRTRPWPRFNSQRNRARQHGAIA